MNKPRKPTRPKKPKAPEKTVKGKRMMPASHGFDSYLSIDDFKEAAKELRCSPESLIFHLEVDYPYYDESTSSAFYWLTYEEIENKNYEKEMKVYKKKLEKYKEKEKIYKEKYKKWKEEMKVWDEIERQQTILDLKKKIQELEG